MVWFNMLQVILIVEDAGQIIINSLHICSPTLDSPCGFQPKSSINIFLASTHLFIFPCLVVLLFNIRYIENLIVYCSHFWMLNLFPWFFRETRWVAHFLVLFPSYVLGFFFIRTLNTWISTHQDMAGRKELLSWKGPVYIWALSGTLSNTCQLT